MKICIIKQYYDILGPRTGFIYKKKSINDILNFFNTKLNGFSSVIFGEADYYILNSYNFKRSECDLVKDNKLEYNYKNIYEATLGTTISEESIPYSDYDIIWCRDPILTNIKQYKNMYPNTLFIYEEVEHNRGYCSLTSKYYDLILKHNSLNFNYQLQKLPMEIAFPYPWSVTKIRNFYDLTKENQLYVDYRDVFIYTINRTLDSSLKTYNDDKKEVIDKFEKIKQISSYPLICNINNSINGLCISNTGLSDSYNYLYILSKSKYYSSLMGRVGQALVDAAVMKCICFGTNKSPNHKLLCHPFTLFNNFQDIQTIITKINVIDNNKTLENEILEYQDKMLVKYYVDYQQNVLKKALELKINNAS